MIENNVADNPKFDLQIFKSDIVNEVSDITKKTTKNPFPIDALPQKIQDVINEFCKSFQLPKDYFGSTILAAAASVIGNSYNIKCKEGWNEPPIIYMAIVGNSSAGKTPAIKACLKPIHKIESSYQQEYEIYKEDWQIKAEAAKAQKDPEPQMLPVKELIINDATTEAVNQTMSHNPNGLLLIQDELIAWINSLNQYRKGSDEEFWLSVWSNTPIKINRKSADPAYIERPSVSVVGGIQPIKLEQLGGGDKKDNGFLARLLFAYPESSEKKYMTDYEVNADTFNTYEKVITNLYLYAKENNTNEDGYWYSNFKTKTVHLSKEAKKAYDKWYNLNVDKINDSEDTEAAIYGKLNSYCLRFSLILELLDAACNGKPFNALTETVSVKSINNSIKLCEYFRATSLKALGKVTNIDPLDKLTKKEREVYSELPTTFKTQDGAAIALNFDMADRTYKRFIKKKDLFDKHGYGIYCKNY